MQNRRACPRRSWRKKLSALVLIAGGASLLLDAKPKLGAMAILGVLLESRL